ncbi:MAG: CBS domain-containing protein [Planctomycetes bacterium]|nr:CBS domain-containing protein [Planctomycetota bacterium]
MAKQEIRDRSDPESMRAFMRALLEDVHALDKMLAGEWFETGIRRIGAEQEMFLVDRGLRPANKALTLLEELPRSHFTTELGQFNLELNLTPLVFQKDCLAQLERELDQRLAEVRGVAEKHGVKVLLTGILPTLEKRHLGLDSMTPIPRYYQLNQIMRGLRGGEFRTYIKGLDEFQCKHDNVMLEAANTSFQLHFQVGPGEFAMLYNVAQLATAPVLAAAVNSPVLLRHRLWHETRVALFQQSVDTRSETHTQRGGRVRVNFGDHWIEESILEIFREDVARYRVLIATELEESPLAKLARGEAPELKALRLHNGTIYRWNRPCYGLAGGKAHLRIEARALPAGPSVLDEVANAAFFFGLMCALSDEYGDPKDKMPFDDAKANFMAAARYGLHARLHWFGGKTVGADELILRELLPLARRGLETRGIDAGDITRYLGVIEQRVQSGRTGAQWMLDSLEHIEGQGRPDERYRALAAGMVAHQWSGKPVHEWPLAEIESSDNARDSYRTVGQYMSTDLFTVHPEDLIDLAASVMDWEQLRHVPVEDHEGHLVGLVTHRQLLRQVSQGQSGRPVAVREIMKPDPITVTPETTTIEALDLMRASNLGCLPVVQDGKLVGLVTESDFIDVSARLLDEWLRQE